MLGIFVWQMCPINAKISKTIRQTLGGGGTAPPGLPLVTPLIRSKSFDLNIGVLIMFEGYI